MSLTTFVESNGIVEAVVGKTDAEIDEIFVAGKAFCSIGGASANLFGSHQLSGCSAFFFSTGRFSGSASGGCVSHLYAAQQPFRSALSFASIDECHQAGLCFCISF